MSAERVARPVLIFDSGIGGLTVLREARVQMPERRFVYVADNAGFPYGDWEEAPLLDHIVTLFKRLLDEIRPEAVVIACNTAFTLAGEALRARFPDTPFIGTVPAIKPAAERTRSGLITVLATPGTVSREYTRALIDRYAAGCMVTLIGSKPLAAMAEAHIRGELVDENALKAEVLPCFQSNETGRTDIIVLACTHYPFLANEFRRLAPWPVDWIDPAEAIARQARRVLAAADWPSEPSHNHDVTLFTNPAISPQTRRLLHGFGLDLNVP
ncbi:glutamate racemase [Martelella alba]|uniref:Glutamate racemase n=1 Tax=Martelella alba TaxID=2590451 RepID=A0A506UIP5_9HYPH|nr:glutamate racemase [Martelella alba]TPW33180.1 glutamate racemase [Martelella alba]